MSGPVTGTSSALRRVAPGGGPAGRPAWLTPVNVVIVVATLVALALRVYYQYRRPGFLLSVDEYDDGPYFGSALRLVHGVLPYRGFVLVQPPGITLLMTPAAALSGLTGTAWALAVGRVATVAASSAGVALAGLLVRHRGLMAAVVTCGVMAVYPDAVAAAHTVLVEPWLVLFCLLGALAVFDAGALASTRRLRWGGVAFGFAGAVEAWAIVPVLVILALCLPRLRRAVAFGGGVAAGFLVPVVPFAALAPARFYQSVIVAQIGARPGAQRAGLLTRLQSMVGLASAHAASTTVVLLAVAAIVVFVAGAQVVAMARAGSTLTALEWFAPVTGALVVAMFCWPPQFHYHFAAFLAPFLAMSVALAAARLAKDAQPLADSWLGGGVPLARLATGTAALILAVMAVIQARWESVTPNVIGPVPAAVDRIVPPGACVLTDQVSVTIEADRFSSGVAGCPLLVDSLGSDLALSGGLIPATGAGRVPAVAALWRNAFDHAQYLLLTPSNGRRIAWTPSLRSYVRSDFVKVFHSGSGLTLYARRRANIP